MDCECRKKGNACSLSSHPQKRKVQLVSFPQLRHFIDNTAKCQFFLIILKKTCQLYDCVSLPHRCHISVRCWWTRGLWLGTECIPFPRLNYSLALAGWEKDRAQIKQRAQESREDLSHYFPVPTQDCSFRWGKPCRNVILANMGEVPCKLEPVWWGNASCCTGCRSPAAAAVLQSRSWV